MWMWIRQKLSYRLQIACQLRTQINNSKSPKASHPNDLQRSLKVIENVTVRYSAYDIVLKFHNNYSPIFYRLPHIARYWLKIANLYTPHLFNTPIGGGVTGMTLSEVCKGV